jgi:ERCC4-related helicase
MNHDSRSFEDDLSSLKADVAVIRSNYVAKADLQAVRIELMAEIQDVRLEVKDVAAQFLSRLDGVRIELKEDLAGQKVESEKLRTEMQAIRAEFHRSLGIQTRVMIGSAATLVAAVYFIVHAGY